MIIKAKSGENINLLAKIMHASDHCIQQEVIGSSHNTANEIKHQGNKKDLSVLK